jgi:hypothetical protein
MTLLSVAGVLALASSAPGRAVAQAAGMQAPQGKEVTITGTVIDVSCKFGQGLSGAEHKMCTEVCADKGIPLAILGTDGKLYIATSAGMPGEGQNARLKPFAEQVVTVKGKAFNAGGAMAIQISSIAKKA